MNNQSELAEIKQLIIDNGKELAHLRGTVEQMNERITTLDNQMSGRMTSIENRMTSIENRMTALEGRVAGQMKWIIGLMVPTWVGMLGLLIAIFLKG